MPHICWLYAWNLSDCFKWMARQANASMTCLKCVCVRCTKNELLSTLVWYSHTTSRLLCVASLKFTAVGYFCFIRSFALSHSLCCAPRFIRSHFNRSALFTVRIHFCMTEAWRCVVVDRTRDRTIFIVFRLDITYQFILLVLSRLTMFFVWFSFVVSCFFARFFVLLSLCFCA